MLAVIKPVLLGVLLASPQAPQGDPPRIVVDEIWQQSGELRMAFTARGLFGQQARQTLEQGGTSTVTYVVELYRKRAAWFDILVRSIQLDFRVAFDPYDKTYRFASEDLRLKTEQYDEIVTQCTRLAEVSMGLLEELDPGGIYYLTVRGSYQPVAAESLEELRNWLGDAPGQGRGEQQERKREGLGSRLGRLLMSAAGFGGKDLQGESARFRPIDLPGK